MKILILSDSHERKIKLDLSKYDVVIHAGDYGISRNLLDDNNVLYVKGNCDLIGDKDKLIIIDDKIVYVTHGDLYKVKYQMNLIEYRAKEVNAKMCIFGHTHYQYYDIYDDILFINPGAYNQGCFVEIINGKILFYQNDILIKELKYPFGGIKK